MYTNTKRSNTETEAEMQIESSKKERISPTRLDGRHTQTRDHTITNTEDEALLQTKTTHSLHDSPSQVLQHFKLLVKPFILALLHLALKDLHKRLELALPLAIH